MYWSIRRVVSASALTVAAVASAQAQAGLSLETYVQAVLRSHPGARQGLALDAAAAAEAKTSRAWPDPTFNYSRDRARPTGAGGPELTESGVTVGQTIPWLGTRSANVRAGDHAAAALRAEALGTRWELEIDARTAFARALFAQAALANARAAEEDARGLRDLTARRADLGESREVDRIKAEVEWLRQQRTRRAAEREVEASEAILRALAVEALPSPLALAGELPSPRAPSDPTELQARLEQSNPRLAAARSDAARDAALASAARRSRIPDLDLAWFHNDELDKESSGFSVGIRVPLWNANRGEIARAEARAALATASAERTRIDLGSALERGRQALDVASAQAQLLESSILPAASRSLDLAGLSYREGETSLLDLLDAQRTFRETQREALEARLALALAIAEVQRQVGPDFFPGR